MKQPVISVIMPCWQCRDTVENAVRSLQDQSFTDWELVAVDDGSADDTLSELQHLASDEPRMRVLSVPHGGVSRARNAGIEAAGGKWLFFLDADDILPGDALDILLSLAEDGVDIVVGAHRLCLTDTGREEIHAPRNGSRREILESLIRGEGYLYSMGMRLYRRKLLETHHIRVPDGIAVGEDVLFNLDCFYVAEGWKMTDQIVYVYLLGGDSAMTRAEKDRFAESMPMIREIERYMDRTGQRTVLFRALMDLYVRTLRVGHSPREAAALLKREHVRNMTSGVQFTALSWKEKAYYLALRLSPRLSIFVP